jgi:hypothetical protein
MKNKQPTIGISLATQVANRLEAGAMLAELHRDYCGTGLRFVDGEYIYGQVYDGLLPSSSEIHPRQEADDVERKTFRKRTEFIAWLAGQTDESLSGKKLPLSWQHNAGRLTIERLQRFVQQNE